MSCHISMCCIDESRNKRRSYEIIARPMSHTIITRWGRVGQKRKRTKRYQLSNIDALQDTLERILRKRLKNGYSYTQYQELRSQSTIPLHHIGLVQHFGQMYLL